MLLVGWKFKHRMAFVVAIVWRTLYCVNFQAAQFSADIPKGEKRSSCKCITRKFKFANTKKKLIFTNIFGIWMFKIIHSSTLFIKTSYTLLWKLVKVLLPLLLVELSRISTRIDSELLLWDAKNLWLSWPFRL